MYRLIETSNNEETIIGEYNNYGDAVKEFEDRMYAFLDGEKEEPIDMSRCEFYFYFEYENGDEYILLVKEY